MTCMPTPPDYAADQTRLHAAVTHALAGRHQAALDELHHVTGKGPASTFRLWQYLCVTACGPIRGKGPNTSGTPRYGLKAFAQWVGTDEQPPAVQTAVRFLTAQARTQADGGRSDDVMRRIFTEARAVPDPDHMDAVLVQLLGAAVEAERQQRLEAGGTFGAGPGAGPV